jgi:hypothetical protein
VLRYNWFFRGTPLLVQIIFWFNLVLLFPQIGLGPVDMKTNTLVAPFAAALLGLALNEGPYRVHGRGRRRRGRQAEDRARAASHERTRGFPSRLL